MILDVKSKKYNDADSLELTEEAEKQIEALARQIAKEVVETTPRGFDVSEEIGNDLVSVEDLVEGKLPLGDIPSPTEAQLALVDNSIKDAIKRGYIDYDGFRLILMEYSWDEYYHLALFGALSPTALTSVQYLVFIDFTQESNPISYEFTEY